MRSVLVTGAAGGIGSHTAQLLPARGWLVGCYDRDAVGAKELASSLGAGAIGGRLDVTADDEWQAALAEVSTAAGGGLHALVNNAGILAGAGGNAQLRHLGLRLTPDQVAAAIVRAVETPDRLKGPHRYVGGQARFFSLATRLAPPTVSRTVVRLLAHH